MNTMLRWLKGGALAMLAASGSLAQAATVQTFALHDARGLGAPPVKLEAAKYLGRKSLRMTVEGEDGDGLTLLPGTDFHDGVI